VEKKTFMIHAIRYALGILCLAVMTLLLESEAPAEMLTRTLGEQDFVDGAVVSQPDFDGASGDEPAPFDRFRGRDIGGPNFSASWTFSYAPLMVTFASLTIGIADHDSQAPGNQIASFTLNGNDLSTSLNAAFEARGGAQFGYNAYAVDIPPALFAELAGGSAEFSLALQPPGLSGPPPTPTSGNGAGLDFARLTFNVIPEPNILTLLGTGAFGLLGYGRRRPSAT
jgi:hypothetical protein